MPEITTIDEANAARYAYHKATASLVASPSDGARTEVARLRTLHRQAVRKALLEAIRRGDAANLEALRALDRINPAKVAPQWSIPAPEHEGA